MSLKTWEAEFYKVGAQSVIKADALDHSILKWTGLLKKNLNKHEVRINGADVVGANDAYGLTIGEASCALCAHYWDWECPDCPLRAVLGARCDNNSSSPYTWWCHTYDARPMLRALRKAKKMQEAK